MRHRHYCGVEGHDWVCTGSTCECICGGTMEYGDHSECAVELRDCAEHQGQLPESPDDEMPSGLSWNLPRNAEKPRCECGCVNAHSKEVVGSCVWCSHVYVRYNARVEAEHFLYHCSEAPEELRMVSQAKLARLN